MNRHIRLITGRHGNRVVALLLYVLGLLVLTGCSHFKMKSWELKPWVKPYERAHLADPIMSFSRNPVEESYISHVYDAREGMRGAEGGSGGGCGCN